MKPVERQKQLQQVLEMYLSIFLTTTEKHATFKASFVLLPVLQEVIHTFCSKKFRKKMANNESIQEYRRADQVLQDPT